MRTKKLTSLLLVIMIVGSLGLVSSTLKFQVIDSNKNLLNKTNRLNCLKCPNKTFDKQALIVLILTYN